MASDLEKIEETLFSRAQEAKRRLSFEGYTREEVGAALSEHVVRCAPDEVLFEELKRRGARMPEIVFDYLRRQSAQRSARWMNGNSFTSLERAAELAGETGELVNVVKKIRREQMAIVGNTPHDQGAQLFDKAEREAGDVFITLLNLADALDLDLWRGIRNAFNDKSEQLGFPERI